MSTTTKDQHHPSAKIPEKGDRMFYIGYYSHILRYDEVTKVRPNGSEVCFGMAGYVARERTFYTEAEAMVAAAQYCDEQIMKMKAEIKTFESYAKDARHGRARVIGRRGDF